MRSHRHRRLVYGIAPAAFFFVVMEARAEFQVNTYTTSSQWLAAAAAAADGSFVVVWASDRQAGPALPGSGSRFDLFARRFDAAGAPLTGEIQVSAFTTTGHNRPAVASDAAGNFVVVWRDSMSGAGGIYGRRFSAAGEPLAGIFPVTVERVFANPSIAVAPSGAFVVAWDRSYGTFTNALGHWFDASGAPVGGPFRVNAGTTGRNERPDVAFDPAGELLVTWRRQASDPNARGIYARRFDANGVPLGDDIPVRPQAPAPVYDQPRAASMGAGRFVVTWFEGHRFWARRIEGPSGQLSDFFQVNTYVAEEQTSREVDVAGDASGAFTVVWAGHRQDGSDSGVFGQRFDAAGARAGREFRVNAYTTWGQHTPAIAARPDGEFVVAWASTTQDGDGAGVFGQVHRDAIFDDGFDSGDLAAWSSAATDGGDLAAVPVEGGAFVLRAHVDDRAPLFVQDDTPEDAGEYRARFSLDPNGFDPGEAAGSQRIRVFLAFEQDPLRRVVALVLRRLGGQYALMARVRLQDDSLADTGFVPISDAPHWIELDWRRATGPDINDGSFTLWIDGAVASELTGLDNTSPGVDFVRLGAMALKSGATGTLYWDEFASRRWSFLGPGPD
jgi:hypothetical protein